MSARDPETGQFVSDDGEMTDYASFEYQQFTFEHSLLDNTGSLLGDVLFAIEPLEPIGGLANNEVAELVGHRLSIALEVEDESDNQTQPQALEARGLFGANFQTVDIIMGNQEDTLTELDSGGDTDNNQSQGAQRARDEIFEVFQVHGGSGFDESTNGAGGATSNETKIWERNWRMSTGRGPVLDSNDELTVANRTVASNTAEQVRAQIRGHLIWDVAETNDAGRQFSVPRSD